MFIPASILMLICVTTFLGFLFLNLFFDEGKAPKPVLLFAFATGIVVITFFTFLFKLLNIELNIFTILSLGLLLIITCIIFSIKKKKKFYFIFEKKLDKNDLILIVVFYLSIFSRIYPIKDLISPLAYDPIVMSTIARLIVDNNGIPGSWEPYISGKLSYPPGFPSVIAWYHIISNTEMWTITLFFTNFIQGLLPLSVYAFALVILKNKYQSIVAATISLIAAYPIFTFPSGDNATLLAYFLAIMTIPLIYVNKNLKKNYHYLILLFIFSVSGFLTYSLYPLYLLLTVIPFFIKELYEIFSIKIVKTYAILLVILILFPFLFTLNYYSQFYTKNIDQTIISDDWNRQARGAIPKQNDIVNIAYDFLFEPFLYIFDGEFYSGFLQLSSVSIYDIVFVFIFLASIFTILKNKIKLGLSFILIYILFVFFSNGLSYIQLKLLPILDKIPALYYARPSKTGQLIFLPISLIFSYFFLEIKKIILFNKLNLAIPILFLLVIVGLSNIITGLLAVSSYPLVSINEKNAMTWINSNTPKNSTILNFIRVFDPGGLKGDAGQWIPAITGRKIMFPAISTPENISMKEIQDRVRIMNLIEGNGTDTIEFKLLLEKFNITYIFLADKYITANYEFKEVSPKEFFNKSNYKLVFQSNQTYVFQVVY